MKLADLYTSLGKVDREALAKKAEISPGYLYQLATQWQGRKPSLEQLKKLAAADKRLSVVELVDEFTVPAAGSGDTPANEPANT